MHPPAEAPYTVFQELMKMLAQDKTKDLPGSREILQDIEAVKRRFLDSLSLEDRCEIVKDLPAEDLLRHLSPEARARLRALLKE